MKYAKKARLGENFIFPNLGKNIQKKKIPEHLTENESSYKANLKLKFYQKMP